MEAELLGYSAVAALWFLIGLCCGFLLRDWMERRRR